MLGKLGVADYAVSVTDWRAGRIVWQSPDRGLRKADWGRESTEVSKATVQVHVPSHIADRIEPWMHCLTIYRAGDVVWHGVVMQVTATASGMSIVGWDGAGYFSRRRVPLARSWAQHDATQVMRTMVEDACGPMDATGIVEGIVTRESRLWVTDSWTPSECMLDDVVDALVKMGLSWSVVAGRLLIGPVGAQHTTATLSDRDLDGDFTVVKDGAEVVTDCHVQGKGVWGQWMDGDSPLGLVQAIEKADGLVREGECIQMAERVVKDAGLVPRRLVVPSGARLLPTAPVSIAELVPGVRVPVSSSQTGVTVASVMQVREVSVSVDSGGEDVKVTLSETSITHEVTDMPDPAEIDMRSPYEKELASKANTGTGSGAKQDEDGATVGTAPA